MDLRYYGSFVGIDKLRYLYDTDMGMSMIMSMISMLSNESNFLFYFPLSIALGLRCCFELLGLERGGGIDACG